jgi:hypothetical protein
MRIEQGRAIPSPEPGLGIDWDFREIERLSLETARLAA